jgi:hypothetical protein
MSRMQTKPGEHIRGSVGAITVRAALLAVIAFVLPAGAWASSPGNETVGKIPPAVQYVEQVAGRLTARSSTSATTGPGLGAATVTATVRVPPVPVVAPPSAPTVVTDGTGARGALPAVRGPSPQPPPLPQGQPRRASPAVTVALPVGAADHAQSAPGPPKGMANRGVGSVGLPATRNADIPLSAVRALGPQLQRLLAGIDVPVRYHPAISVFVVSALQAHGSALGLGLVIRQPPVSTRSRLARGPGLPAGQPSSGGVNGTRAPSALARVDAALPAAASVTTPAQSLQRAARSWRARGPTAGAVESSVTVGGAPPIPGSYPAGAAAGSASGGMGVGAAGAALLAVAALWLLHVLLPGRLALELFPWRSTLLSLRLERPG